VARLGDHCRDLDPGVKGRLQNCVGQRLGVGPILGHRRWRGIAQQQQAKTRLGRTVQERIRKYVWG
jgi:hypothetical protein